MTDVMITKSEPWYKRLWRPFMAWQYAVVCLADFLILPMLYTHLQASSGVPLVQWQPITLQGSGLYHVSMLTVNGIYTYQRTQEKIEAMKKNIVTTASDETISTSTNP